MRSGLGLRLKAFMMAIAGEVMPAPTASNAGLPAVRAKHVADVPPSNCGGSPHYPEKTNRIDVSVASVEPCTLQRRRFIAGRRASRGQDQRRAKVD